jgi:hypothetical protein
VVSYHGVEGSGLLGQVADQVQLCLSVRGKPADIDIDVNIGYIFHIHIHICMHDSLVDRDDDLDSELEGVLDVPNQILAAILNNELNNSNK